MSFIFDTLVWKDDQGYVPALAESWEYLEDENAYTFKLRNDVSWHDGEKFTPRMLSSHLTISKNTLINGSIPVLWKGLKLLMIAQ